MHYKVIVNDSELDLGLCMGKWIKLYDKNKSECTIDQEL